jgi:hypothetical protein
MTNFDFQITHCLLHRFNRVIWNLDSINLGYSRKQWGRNQISCLIRLSWDFTSNRSRFRVASFFEIFWFQIVERDVINIGCWLALVLAANYRDLGDGLVLDAGMLSRTWKVWKSFLGATAGPSTLLDFWRNNSKLRSSEISSLFLPFLRITRVHSEEWQLIGWEASFDNLPKQPWWAEWWNNMLWPNKVTSTFVTMSHQIS